MSSISRFLSPGGTKTGPHDGLGMGARQAGQWIGVHPQAFSPHSMKSRFGVISMLPRW